MSDSEVAVPHSVTLSSRRQTWHPAGALTAFCPSGQGLVKALRFYFLVGGECLCPLLSNGLLNGFVFIRRNMDTQFFFEPFVVLPFFVDADMIVMTLNTSIRLFSQFISDLILLKVTSIASAVLFSFSNNYQTVQSRS